jgi:iron(III) transport system ATP-binding protein
MTAILTVRNVTKRYSVIDAPVVDGIDLELYPGELLALLGPSGCGKTTVLRSIAGFEKPEHGDITLLDKTMCNKETYVRPEKRGIGFVFQDYALFPHLNVEQNIGFGLKHLTRAKRQELIEKALELSGLDGLGKRAPHELSGGQQQRVALARSMAPGPKVILLDEPFSNLDATLREDTRKEVRDILKRSGMSAILVTHDQEEALTFSDRISVMNNGRIEQCGSPIDIYRNPKTPFVAQFLGTTNLIHAEAKGICAHTPFGCMDIDKNSNGEVLLSVRPEQLKIKSASDEYESGIVTSRKFKGHDQYYRIRFGNKELVVLTDHRSEFKEGELVSVETTEPVVVLEGMVCNNAIRGKCNARLKVDS